MTGSRGLATVAALCAATVLAQASTPARAAAPGVPVVLGGPQLATAGTVVGAVSGTGASLPPLPAVVAGGWVVADLDTGAVLAAHDPHGAYAPASCLKVLTADVVIPRLPAHRQVRVSSAEANVGGTRVGIVPGHTYSVGELLQGMLMVSGNDAATALATANGGVATTVAAMNARAAALNADDTVARTVDGLDAPGQHSSAYDLALIARAALALPSFRADVAARLANFSSPGVPTFQIQNHNPLLGSVPGIVGVKNGYTVAAQASFVGLARRGDTTILVTLLRTRPDFAAEATALLDWGFAADGRLTPVGTLVPPGPVARTVSLRQPAAPAATVRASRAGAGLETLPVVAGSLGGAALVAAAAMRVRVVRRRRRRRRQRRPSWR